jgi:hypothetical protein
MKLTESGVDVSSSLVSHYKLNENAANTSVIDSSGGNTGTCSVNTSAVTAAGMINSSFNFAGAQNVDLTDDTDFEFGSSDFSVTAWIYPNSAGWGGIFSKWDAAADLEFVFALNGDNELYLGSSYDGSSFTAASTSTSIATSTWTHVALKKSGAVASFYINDSLDSSVAAKSTFYAGNAKAYIGDTADLNLKFDGRVDDLRVYNKLISSGAQSAIYNGGEGTESSVAPTALVTEIKVEYDT